MKKIGIITLTGYINYGNILQNYALQTILKRLGHRVWTIDLKRYSWLHFFYINGCILFYKLLGRNQHFRETPIKWAKKQYPLRRFVYSHISLTVPRIRWFRASVIERYHFDCLLVGSDQVWRPRYNPRIEDLYFQFAKGFSLRRVAYAASFGTDDWEYTLEQQTVCAPLAQMFDAISVREQSGVNLCRTKLGVSADWVLDPTMLLTKSDYCSLCSSIDVRSPFIFAYILDENEKLVKEVERIATLKNLPYLIKSADKGIESSDSIELWLSYFLDANFVITDSFHGTVFSILFRKEFILLKNSSRGSARFDSL